MHMWEELASLVTELSIGIVNDLILEECGLQS